MLDPQGRVVTWNLGAEQIKGYTEAEIVGSHFSRFFTPEDIAAGKPARQLVAAARDGRYEDEAWRVRQDGSVFWADVVISSIRDSTGKLVGFTKVTRDLTEQRKAEQERVRLAQSQESLRLKDEFLSIASHELKTPLTALQLQLRGIFDRIEARDGRLVRKMDRATRASERLGDLIESLLDVSRISSGHFTLNLESFDLVASANEVIERVRDAAVAAECALTLKSRVPVVGTWDRLRVEQIMTNLLSNAFKYAAGKAVEVTVTRQDESALLEVRDWGHGVPESDLHRLFERFERASRTEYAGLGLGLYVARQMAEAHGGKVSARNIEGNGACFSVQLPLIAKNALSDSNLRA
jgi:PAS domain S-box-containing protein